MSNTSNKRGRGESAVNNAKQSAPKWAAEFSELDEEDQYTYLEEMAKVMSQMHMQFLQGIMRTDEQDDEEEEEGEFDDEEDGEDAEEDAEEGDGDD